MTKKKEEQKTYVTSQMILAKKNLLEQKPAPFYSEMFGGELEIENDHPQSFSDTIRTAQDDELYAYSKLIYENCPAFRDKELLKEYEVDDPFLLVSTIYKKNTYEMLLLGNHILQAYGFNNIDVIKKK